MIFKMMVKKISLIGKISPFKTERIPSNKWEVGKKKAIFCKKEGKTETG
jgi:hypothetical protein